MIMQMDHELVNDVPLVGGVVDLVTLKLPLFPPARANELDQRCSNYLLHPFNYNIEIVAAFLVFVLFPPY